jgi:hypothetical protein
MATVRRPRSANQLRRSRGPDCGFLASPLLRVSRRAGSSSRALLQSSVTTSVAGIRVCEQQSTYSCAATGCSVAIVTDEFGEHLRRLADVVDSRLEVSNPLWRERAEVAVVEFDDRPSACKKLLIAALHSSDSSNARLSAIRFAAFLAGRLPSSTSWIAQQVITRLSIGDLSETERAVSVTALALDGSSDSVRMLDELSRDPASSVRRRVAIMLNLVAGPYGDLQGVPPDNAVEAISIATRLSADSEPTVRDGAAFTLGQAAPAHPVVLPTLHRLTADADPSTRDEARTSLRALEQR